MRWGGIIGGSLALIILDTVLQPKSADQAGKGLSTVAALVRRFGQPDVAGIPQRGAPKAGAEPTGPASPGAGGQGAGGGIMRPTTTPPTSPGPPGTVFV